MGNTDFSWFARGCYLKDDNGKYYALYATATSFAIVQVASLSMANSGKQALPWACILTKDKAANIYTDSIYAFGECNGTLLQYSCLENPMDGGAW